jgi:hypothetical protein
MPTQAADILSAVIASSLAFDGGSTPVANDTGELLNVLNRRLGYLYTLAGAPSARGGMGQGDFFGTSSTVTLSASPVALPAAAFRHSFTTALGTRVAVVPQNDIVDSVPELPPAVTVQQNQVLSLGRTGDPIPGDVLTVYYTPLPGSLSLPTDYVGATTPSDSTTTVWPSAVGDPYLVAWLRRYLCYKSADHDPTELQAIDQDLQEAAQALGTLIGIEATRLLSDEAPRAT